MRLPRFGFPTTLSGIHGLAEAWAPQVSSATVMLHRGTSSLAMVEPWLIERAYQWIVSGRPRQPMFLLDTGYLLRGLQGYEKSSAFSVGHDPANDKPMVQQGNVVAYL